MLQEPQFTKRHEQVICDSNVVKELTVDHRVVIDSDKLHSRTATMLIHAEVMKSDIRILLRQTSLTLNQHS